MSTESFSANEAAAAQEFPDRVGFKPDNPYLASFQPYIPATVALPELTVLPLIMGTVLGIIFGASSLYLVLKVGMTVSASIPQRILGFGDVVIDNASEVGGTTILRNINNPRQYADLILRELRRWH